MLLRHALFNHNCASLRRAAEAALVRFAQATLEAYGADAVIPIIQETWAEEDGGEPCADPVWPGIECTDGRVTKM